MRSLPFHAESTVLVILNCLSFLDFLVNENVSHKKLITASVLNAKHNRGKKRSQCSEKTSQVSQKVKHVVDTSEILLLVLWNFVSDWSLEVIRVRKLSGRPAFSFIAWFFVDTELSQIEHVVKECHIVPFDHSDHINFCSRANWKPAQLCWFVDAFFSKLVLCELPTILKDQKELELEPLVDLCIWFATEAFFGSCLRIAFIKNDHQMCSLTRVVVPLDFQVVCVFYT